MTPEGLTDKRNDDKMLATQENSMTREERHAQFVKEWYDLRNRYLDYYIEFWAPDDVIQVVQDAGGLPDGMEMENVVVDVMERIRTNHDASQGVTWETLAQVYEIILEEDKVLKGGNK